MTKKCLEARSLRDLWNAYRICCGKNMSFVEFFMSLWKKRSEGES